MTRRYAWIRNGAQASVAFPSLRKAEEFAVTGAVLCWRLDGRWWPV